MNFNINIDKKFAFIILGAVLILAGAIYANAYGGNDPEIMGHNIGELEGINCGVGKYLRYTSGVGWSCETDASAFTECPAGNFLSYFDFGNGDEALCLTSAEIVSIGGGVTSITDFSSLGIIASIGSNGNLGIIPDFEILQKRVSSSCSAGKSIRQINDDGTVVCETDDVGGGGGGGLSDCTTITTTYSNEQEESCPSGYIAVAASCKMGTDAIVNGEFPAAPGSSSGYTQYLIPNVNSATGVHCDTFSSAITSQLHLRCCR